MIKLLSRYQKPIYVSFTLLYISLKPKIIKHFSKLTGLRNITAGGQKHIKDLIGLSVLTNLHKLELGIGPCPEANKIYQNLNQLTTLNCLSLSLSEQHLNAKSQLLELQIHSISKTFMPKFAHISHLTSLIVYDEYLDNTNTDVLKEAYHLKQLKVSCTDSYNAGQARPAPLTLRTLTALENLEITHFSRSNDDIYHLTSLTKLKVSDKFQTLTSEWTALANLKELYIHAFMGARNPHDYPFADYYRFLTALTKLTDLTIIDHHTDAIHFLPYVPTSVTFLKFPAAQRTAMESILQLVNLQQLYLINDEELHIYEPENYGFLRKFLPHLKIDIVNK